MLHSFTEGSQHMEITKARHPPGNVKVKPGGPKTLGREPSQASLPQLLGAPPQAFREKGPGRRYKPCSSLQRQTVALARHPFVPTTVWGVPPALLRAHSTTSSRLHQSFLPSRHCLGWMNPVSRLSRTWDHKPIPSFEHEREG